MKIPVFVMIAVVMPRREAVLAGFHAAPPRQVKLLVRIPSEPHREARLLVGVVGATKCQDFREL